MLVLVLVPVLVSLVKTRLKGEKTAGALSILPFDQHQISPYNTNAYSTPEVMRIEDMTTKVNFLIFPSTFIRKVW